MSRPTPTSVSFRAQGGAVLFVALIFLILLTLLGLTASGTSIMQERMTGGLRNAQLSLMGSETAARGAESWLWNLASNNAHINCGYNGGANGFCYRAQTFKDSGGNTILRNNPLVEQFRTYPAWLSGGTTTNVPTTLTGSGNGALAQRPVYLMEDLGQIVPPGSPPVAADGAQGRDGQLNRASGVPVLYNYRITARSTGGNEGAVRVVEVNFGTGVPSN